MPQKRSSVLREVAAAPDDVWLTEDQAARYLKCAASTLNRWRRLGIGPRYSKLHPWAASGTIRYKRADLDRYMREHGPARRGRPKQPKNPPSDLDVLLDRLAEAERICQILCAKYAGRLIEVSPDELSKITRKVGVKSICHVPPSKALKFVAELQKASDRAETRESAR